MAARRRHAGTGRCRATDIDRRGRCFAVTTGEWRSGRALAATTQELVGRLDDVLWAIYQAVDQAQRRTVDAALDVATLAAFTPDWIGATARMAAAQWAEAMRVFGSCRGVALGYRELTNKLEVFTLVKHARRFIGTDLASEDQMPHLVDVAYLLPPFLRLWAVEGLGHDYADWARAHGGGTRLLTAAGALPDRALLMLHAGLGLSIGDAVLRGSTPFDDAGSVPVTVEAFRDECERSSRPGYAGCAYESLGLVTRTLHPPLVAAVDRALTAAAPDLRPYFWHGVGRALYFSPLEFLPGVSSPWARLESEPPDAEARLNATAGLAWATALVNVREPEIVAALLPSIGETVSRDDAVASGVLSSFAMALATDAANPFVPRFCAYAPTDAASERLWSAAIPAIDAVQRLRQAESGIALERLFQYRAVGHVSGSGM